MILTRVLQIGFMFIYLVGTFDYNWADNLVGIDLAGTCLVGNCQGTCLVGIDLVVYKAHSLGSSDSWDLSDSSACQTEYL